LGKALTIKQSRINTHTTARMFRSFNATLTKEQLAKNEEHFLWYMRNSKIYTWKDAGEIFDFKDRRKIVPQRDRGFIMLSKIVSKDFMFNYVEPPADTKEDLWEVIYPTVSSFKCVLCKKNVKGYGNNANPLCEGRCCDSCNYDKVLPRRIAECQVEHLAKSGGEVGKLAKKGDLSLINALACLVKQNIELGGNEFSLDYTPAGSNEKLPAHTIAIAPRCVPELASNRMKTPPPQSDDDLARLFKDADLKGLKTHKKHQSKSKLEAKQEAEETRLANLALQEERKRRREFEKEVAEKAKIAKTKTHRK